MRIIAGKLKGRRFQPPKNIPARPTTDFAREAFFNILTNTFDLESITFLDLFSGTGAMSYEMASRGCTQIICVESDGKSIAFIKKTISALMIPASILQTDAFSYLRNTKSTFDVIFADPPYALETLAEIPALIFASEVLKQEGWFILEHGPKHSFETHPHFIQKRNYGTTIFSIFGYQ